MGEGVQGGCGKRGSGMAWLGPWGKSIEDAIGGDESFGLHIFIGLGEGFLQSLSVLSLEVVPALGEHELDFAALGEVCWLVQNESPVPDPGNHGVHGD